jgi:hypothetical protein
MENSSKIIEKKKDKCSNSMLKIDEGLSLEKKNK